MSQIVIRSVQVVHCRGNGLYLNEVKSWIRKFNCEHQGIKMKEEKMYFLNKDDMTYAKLHSGTFHKNVVSDFFFKLPNIKSIVQNSI